MRPAIRQTSVGFQLVSSLPLIRLTGIGWEHQTTSTYYWDGRTRRCNPHCLLQYTLSGHGEVEIEGTVYRLQQGDAFLVEIPGEHCYRLPEASDGWEILYICFSMEALPLWQQLKSMAGSIISLPQNSSFLVQLWDTYRLAVENQLTDVYQCSKHAYQLLMELNSHFHNNREVSTITQPIESCRQFIHAQFAESIGLDEMAAAAGISKFHLIRQFDQLLGITPTRYLIKVRLEKAVLLLIHQTGMDLEEVAQQVGFSCGNYFGKVFKKYTGMTPAVFRSSYHPFEVSHVQM